MTIFFPDLSHYVSGVPLTGVVALITKATQGTSYVDPTYADYRDKAHVLGIPFAGYHYVTTDDPTEQARHAFAIIGRDVPAMWDVEAGSGSIANLLAVHDAYTTLGGRATLAYVPQWYWGQIGRPDLRPLTARGLALISSAYTAYSDAGIGWKPYGGITPDIWQYTSSGPLNGHRVDMNAFRGTVAELRKLFVGGTSAGDVGVDMPLTQADADLVAATLKRMRVDDAGPPPTDPTAPVTLGVAIRGSYFRDGYVANTAVPAIEAAETDEAAALERLHAELASLPAAVVAALPEPGPGGLTVADVQAAAAAAVTDVISRTTAALTVAPSPES
jgi:hypothetical protein